MERKMRMHTMRLTARQMTLLVLLVLLTAQCADANPIPPPPRAFTLEDLRTTLANPAEMERSPATLQLAALGPSHLEVVAEALASRYPDVQLAAITALWSIGNEPCLALLRTALRDSSDTHPPSVRVAAAEALADLRDPAALALMEQLVSPSEDDQIKRGLSKAILIHKRSLVDQPALSLLDDHVLLHFLLSDIVDLYVTDIFGREPRFRFPEEDWAPICQLLQEGEPTGGGTWMPKLLLHTCLADAREALLATDCRQDRFDYRGNGRVLSRSGFSITNGTLATWLRENTPQELLPRQCRSSGSSQEERSTQ
jgi:hypothetical protein